MGTTALAAAPGKAMLWAPRLLAAAVSLFLATFSLDAFRPGAPLTQSLPDFMMHLIPAVLVLLVVALAWDAEWIGAVAFAGMAAAYAVAARTHPSWIAVISGPLLVVAAFYSWNAMHRTKPA
jgi:hypothetical protein